ncbi:MAG: 4Fe-4S dicluster domain-containing protein, partial [Desulfobacteraceae bacterium]|nr:4Fe-4S dicluster domain-containing protein [Desulfobacteraceae bacterium]
MEKGKVNVFRYDPERDRGPRYETYEFPFEPGMSVLDVALYIYENIDGTFTFSYCCRNSHCGLCGAKINGRAGLMCRESATPEMLLEPLDNFSVVRDLMIDRKQYEEQMPSLRLFLESVSDPPSLPEKIFHEDLERFKVVSRCVECYSCISECTTYREDRHAFLGPAGVVQLARHVFDPRDELNRDVMAYSAGIYNCTLCGRCTVVCPHRISPKATIETLRAGLVNMFGPPRAVTQLVELVKECEKAVPPPIKKKSFLEEVKRDESAKVGLFVGCNMDYDSTLIPIAFSATKVLLGLNVDLVIPSDQVCCGMPLVEAGAVDQLEELIVKNVEAFKKTGCEIVVTLCSGCGFSGKSIWPDVYRKATGKELPFTFQDITEFLTDLPLSSEAFQAVKSRVSYHDPCLLNRGQGV